MSNGIGKNPLTDDSITIKLLYLEAKVDKLKPS